MDRANFEFKVIYMTLYSASCLKLVFHQLKHSNLPTSKHSFFLSSKLALKSKVSISFLFATSSTLNQCL